MIIGWNIYRVEVSIAPVSRLGYYLSGMYLSLAATDPDEAVAAAEEAVRLRWPGFRLSNVESCHVIVYGDELRAKYE